MSGSGNSNTAAKFSDSVELVHKDGNFHLRYKRQEREAARAQEKGGKNDVITVFKKKKRITFNVQLGTAESKWTPRN